MTSALHHASTLSRPLIFAAVLRGSTTVRALGAATSAGAREGEARRREGGSYARHACHVRYARHAGHGHYPGLTDCD